MTKKKIQLAFINHLRSGHQFSQDHINSDEYKEIFPPHQDISMYPSLNLKTRCYSKVLCAFKMLKG